MPDDHWGLSLDDPRLLPGYLGEGIPEVLRMV